MRNTWLFRLAKTFFVVMVVFAFAASAMAASKIGKTREEIIKLSKKEPPVRIATTWAGKIINFQKQGFKKKIRLVFRLHQRVRAGQPGADNERGA